MKIEYRKGNILETDCKYILHGCNAKGVMGGGVAAAIRSKYPKAYYDYRSAYETDGLQLGTIIPSKQIDGKIILNAITQETFGNTGLHVSYWAVANVMKSLNGVLDEDFTEFTMPKLGAGLGGGDWNVISVLIETELKRIQPIVYVLE
jgi:O-acetyl-ADP-ribose deacetylase (regulator of RNase III)